MISEQGFRNAVINIEKILAEYAGNEVEAMRHRFGNKMASELLASIACLFAARSTAMIHVWSGEPIESIKKRVFEAFDQDIKMSLKRFSEAAEEAVSANVPRR